MSTAVSTSEISISKPKSDFSIYELRYRKGGLMHTFFFKWTDKQGAIEKGKEYCEKKSLRFISVNEWLQDIQKMIDFEPDEEFRR